MDVVCSGPLKTASLLWQSRPGTPVLTVVCKITFKLLPDESQIAEEQDDPLEEDAYYEGDRSRSVYAPSDLVPFKPRADVLLVGSAFAPRKDPVRSVVARLIIADIDKSIEVFGDRSLTRDGQLREGSPFAKMPLVYERAAGGPDTSNPVGVQVDGEPGPQGTIALPNLQPRTMSLSGAGSEIPPVGFGPIGPTWPSRLAALGRHAGAWPMPGWHDRPVPEGVSPTYFNAAPADQQLDAIRDAERILLENLHPEFPRLSTALPGLRPRAVVERPGAAPDELKLKADTLWIETDRGVCTVTWRGQVPLKHRVEPGRVVVSMDQPMARLLRGSLPPAIDRAGPTPLPPAPRTSPRIAALSFVDGATGDVGSSRGASISPRLADKAAASPKRGTLERIAAAAARDLDPEDTVTLSDASPTESPDMQLRGPPTTASPEPFVSAAQGVRAPTGAHAVLSVAEPLTPRNTRSSAEKRDDTLPPPPVASSLRRDLREALKLIWLDPKAMPRLRAERKWKGLWGLALQRSAVFEDGQDAGRTDVPSSRDKRDVLSLLARVDASREGGVKQAIVEAIGDDGALDPPLVLVSGELELPFDEIAALKATVMAASPLVTTDETLEEALNAARELLKSPWPPGSGGLVAGVLSRVKSALAQAGRASMSSMEAHTDRMLLEQRSYQWRTVFGRRWIRGLLRASPEASEATTVYLPEATRDELPLFRRFRVKLVGEADLQEDEAEPFSCVVKVMALSRVAKLP